MQRWATNISLKNGSAVAVDVLVNPINPAHSLVVVFDQEWLAIVHPFPRYLDHHLIFWTEYKDPSLFGDNADDIVIVLPYNV